MKVGWEEQMLRLAFVLVCCLVFSSFSSISTTLIFSIGVGVFLFDAFMFWITGGHWGFYG